MPSSPDAAPVTVEEAKETIRDALMDSQYLAGAKAGWNAAQADDPEATYAALMKSREGHLAGYKEAKALLAATPSDRARVDGEVTQEDRDRAADCIAECWSKGLNLPNAIREGRADHGQVVQAFRDHRQAAEQRALAAENDRDVVSETLAHQQLLAIRAGEEIRTLRTALAASEQRVRELVEALKPFATLAKQIEEQGPRGTWMGSEFDDYGAEIVIHPFKGSARNIPDDLEVISVVVELVGANAPEVITMGHLRHARALLPAAEGGSGEG